MIGGHCMQDFSILIWTFHSILSKEIFFVSFLKNPQHDEGLGAQNAEFSVKICTSHSILNNFILKIEPPPHEGWGIGKHEFLSNSQCFIILLANHCFSKFTPIPLMKGVSLVVLRGLTKAFSWRLQGTLWSHLKDKLHEPPQQSPLFRDFNGLCEALHERLQRFSED